MFLYAQLLSTSTTADIIVAKSVDNSLVQVSTPMAHIAEGYFKFNFEAVDGVEYYFVVTDPVNLITARGSVMPSEVTYTATQIADAVWNKVI